MKVQSARGQLKLKCAQLDGHYPGTRVARSWSCEVRESSVCRPPEPNRLWAKWFAILARRFRVRQSNSFAKSILVRRTARAMLLTIRAAMEVGLDLAHFNRSRLPIGNSCNQNGGLATINRRNLSVRDTRRLVEENYSSRPRNYDRCHGGNHERTTATPLDSAADHFRDRVFGAIAPETEHCERRKVWKFGKPMPSQFMAS